MSGKHPTAYHHRDRFVAIVRHNAIPFGVDPEYDRAFTTVIRRFAALERAHLTRENTTIKDRQYRVALDRLGRLAAQQLAWHLGA